LKRYGGTACAGSLTRRKLPWVRLPGGDPIEESVKEYRCWKKQ